MIWKLGPCLTPQCQAANWRFKCLLITPWTLLNSVHTEEEKSYFEKWILYETFQILFILIKGTVWMLVLYGYLPGNTSLKPLNFSSCTYVPDWSTPVNLIYFSLRPMWLLRFDKAWMADSDKCPEIWLSFVNYYGWFLKKPLKNRGKGGS